MKKLKHDDFIFQSSTVGKSMSDMAVGALIKRMNKARSDARLPLWCGPKEHNALIVPHGFRSTFSTFIADKTDYAEDLREACLAHALKNKVMAAYQRGDECVYTVDRYPPEG